MKLYYILCREVVIEPWSLMCMVDRILIMWFKWVIEIQNFEFDLFRSIIIDDYFVM